MVPANAPNMNPTVTILSYVCNIFSFCYAIIFPNNVMTYHKKMYLRLSQYIPYALHSHLQYNTPFLKENHQLI